MSLSTQRAFTLIVCITLMAAGGFVAVSGVASREAGPALLGLVVASGAGATLFFQLRRFALLESQSYDWYRYAYPDCIKRNGVSCYNCGSKRIQVRNLMNHLYYRAHVCSQCGETLYYSPEQR